MATCLRKAATKVVTDVETGWCHGGRCYDGRRLHVTHGNKHDTAEIETPPVAVASQDDAETPPKAAKQWEYENLMELYNAAHSVAIRTKAATIFEMWGQAELPGVPFMWAIFAASRFIQHGHDVACLFFNCDREWCCRKGTEERPHACFLCGGDHPLHLADDISEPVLALCACTKWKALVEEFQRFCNDKNMEPACLRKALCVDLYSPKTPCHDHAAEIEVLNGKCADVTDSNSLVSTKSRAQDNDLEFRLLDARILLRDGFETTSETSASQQYIATLTMPHSLWQSPENETTGNATCEGRMWSAAVVLFDIMERTEACDPSVPMFYHRSADVEQQQKKKTWARRLRLDWEDDGFTPIPPTTNPWLKAVMEQLLVGKPYRGLMTLEPAEFRDAVTRLTDEHADGNWRLLRDELSAAEVLQAEGDPEALLRHLREEVVEHRLPMSCLYVHERLSAVIAAMDEAVPAAGLCNLRPSPDPATDYVQDQRTTIEDPADDPVQPRSLSETIEDLVCDFWGQLSIDADHTILRFPTDNEDAAAGLLLCCTCDACANAGKQNVWSGVWHPDPTNSQHTVAVDVTLYRLEEHQLPQFECEIQDINNVRSSRGLPAPITVHGFFREGPFHFAAAPQDTVGGNFEHVIKTSLANDVCFPLAQALLREGRVLWDIGVTHGDIRPDNLHVSCLNDTVRVAFRNFTLSMAPTCDSSLWRLTSSSGRCVDMWALALLLCEIMTSMKPTDIPAFYEQHGALSESDAVVLNGKWSDDGFTPIPPTTNPWLKAVMKQLLAGKPYRGLMTLEPAEFGSATPSRG